MQSDRSSEVGVVMVTRNGKDHLPYSLPPYLNDALKPRVLVIDSSSEDGTAELAQKMGAEVVVIPEASFNHGATREFARKRLNTPIVIMATQDAYPIDAEVVGKLIAPIKRGETSVAYARQIPHEGAGFFESFSRTFNYPEQGHVRSFHDVNTYGVYIFFCSNSCAAYSNEALDSVGGFPTTSFGEDTLVVSKLLRAGKKIAYVSEAIVKHSHHYTLKEEFKRYFTIGWTRDKYALLFECGFTDAQRGWDFTIAMLKALIKKNPLLLPYGLIQTVVKWSGYQLGRMRAKRV